MVDTERAAYSIPVEPYRSSHDDFDEWIKMFEDAVVLATRVTDPFRKDTLCKTWLPFKLDDEARMVFHNIAAATFVEIREELKNLLIDPQAAYNWQTNRSTLQWDGKESFHALAVRVKRSVDKYDPDAPKPKEYFFRFRQALPKRFRTAIDLGCAEDKRTIEEAKKIAMRVQMTEADSEVDKGVSFTGASMADDRIQSLEMDMKKLDTRMESVEGSVKKIEGNVEKLCSRPRGYKSSLEGYSSRYPDGGRGRSPDWRDNGECRNWNRRDSGGRPDDQDRHEGRGSYDHGNENDRHTRNSHDRMGSRDGSGSRDRRDGRGYQVDRDQRRGFDGHDDKGQWGNRDERDQNPRDSRDGRDQQSSRENGGSRDRGGQSSRRDDRDGDDRYPSRDSRQGSNNIARPEGCQTSRDRGSSDEDYELFCSMLSDIEMRRANRRRL